MQPGWMDSSLARARSILRRMSSSLAVQTNGCGSAFQAARKASMACTNSGTLTKAPRRIQIQTHHVGQLLHKLRIPRQLECPAEVRLEVMQLPKPVDRVLAHALGALAISRQLQFMPLGLVCKVAAISASHWARSYCGLRPRPA